MKILGIDICRRPLSRRRASQLTSRPGIKKKETEEERDKNKKKDKKKKGKPL
jgi:hypothetical protein